MSALRVLIVDDDQDFAQSLALLMRRRGYKVQLAFSGEEAIEKFRQQDASGERPFDITFMDVKLPGRNGVESFLEIRKFTPDAKVVMMTGYSVKQLLEKAVNHGVWGVLDKPIDIQNMLGLLDDIKPNSILIVDDDVDFVESVDDLLSNDGYTVFSARNGREALECIRSNDIDVVILDLRTPILGGVDTLLELKRIGSEIPTIIITAYADEDTNAVDELRSLAVGGVLRKPFDPRELLDAVERLSRADSSPGGQRERQE